MLCNQCLIGCDNTLSRLKAAFHKCICRFNASHHLNYDTDFRIINDHIHIMNDLLLDRITRKISEIEYIFDIDLIGCTLIDDIAVRIDYFHDSGTHGAVSHYCYIYHRFLLICTL